MSVIETEQVLRTIGEEGGVEAVALIGALMDKNHRDLEATFESLYLGEKAAHDRTKEQLGEALDRLARIEDRIWGFLS